MRISSSSVSPLVRCIQISQALSTLLLAAALLLSPLRGRGQTVFFDFNSPGEYTNNFQAWNDNGGSNGGSYDFMESPTAGVDGGGGVAVFQSSDTTASCIAPTWNFSTNGSTVAVSVMIKANGQVSGNKVQLGLANSDTNGLNSNAGVAFESFRFIPVDASTWSLREQYRSGGVTSETVISNVSVVSGRWYKFVVGVTNTGGAAGNFNAGCAIYDYGSDGVTAGRNIIEFPILQAHTGLTNLTIPSVWAVFRAFQNGGVDAWDNFLGFTAASPPVATLSLTNESVAVGNKTSFNFLAEGPGVISYTWFLNGNAIPAATNTSYTTPPVDNTYHTISVVARNANGTVSNSSTVTVYVPSLAVMTNLPATVIQSRAAVINGAVLTTGGDPPVVFMHYGPVDGGTNAAGWINSVILGTQSGSFSLSLTNLTPNQTYFFTCEGDNGVGTAWANPSASFTTLPVSPAHVINQPATAVAATYATLNGLVTSIGGDEPHVTLYYGTSDGGTTASSWAHSADLGLQSGAFSETVGPLSSNTTYYFTAEAVNAGGVAWAIPSVSFTTQATNPVNGTVAVLTQHNDLARTGANLAETVLNIQNVNSNQFGLIASRSVDDQVYAQPLVMTNVAIPGRGVHNIVIVATVNDSVYAFDADDMSVKTPYWTNSFIHPPNIVAPRNTDMTGACGGNYMDFSGNIGIVSTPVIDPATGTIYLVERTKENGSTFVQRLHALDITTGLDRSNSPTIITATYPGTGDGSVNGVVTFDSQRQNQRSGLTLVGGVVYITWSSHCDWGPYHGWIIGYDAATMQQAVVYNNTPDGYDGGIWMSGQAIAADTNGNLFLSVANGSVGTPANPRDLINRGESFLKLVRNGTNFTVASYFTPYNWQDLENGDIDLGSGGMLLIPGTDLAFAGGKQGVAYLVNRDNMGGLTTSTTGDPNVVQSIQVTFDQVHGGPVWWDAPGASYAYIWPSSVYLQQYRFDPTMGKFQLPVFAQSPTPAPSGQPGGFLAISANGSTPNSGILWASHQLNGDANQSVRPGIFHAYNAQNVSQELWNSEQVSARDSVADFAKFCAPTVANGKVYLATFSGSLNIYGLLPPPQLSVNPSGGVLTFAWPTNAFQKFTLQTSSTLSPPTWTNATNSVTQTNGMYQITVPPTGPAAYYRLKL